jgi:thiol:disulfide interchange protein DsbD
MITVRWILCLLGCLWAQAAEKNPLTVRMLSEMSQISAGQTFWVGFQLKHPPGYHTYWKHPGVIGVATTITWQLPAGFTAGQTVWPAPQKVMMSIHRAQGYRDDTLLMVPITAPAILIKEPVTLRAQLDWMCCHQSCHPAHAVPFSLTIMAGREALVDETNAPLFAQARAAVPEADARWLCKATIRDQQVLLTVAPAPGNLRRIEDLGELWFFSGDGAIDSSTPQVLTRLTNSSLQLAMQRYEFGPRDITRLSGVLQASKGWAAEGKKPCIAIDAATEE